MAAQDISRPDPEFLVKISPLVWLLERYFRYEVRGIENLPRRGPGLVVMNHGVLPFHAYMLIKEIFFQVGRLPRMLGAKFLFQVPLLRHIALQVGALDANHRNAKAALRGGDLVMVAPGGIYEALLVHPGMRTVPWYGRYGFSVLACKMGVPIIPSYCAGINEAYFTSAAFLKQRVRFLRRTWFSLPFFFGIGILPFPVKLVHRIGKPILPKRRKGESFRSEVRRVHEKVLAAVKELMREKD
ncbi:MAG: lysophospholipid acyltransferase family protein [bacterium]